MTIPYWSKLYDNDCYQESYNVGGFHLKHLMLFTDLWRRSEQTACHYSHTQMYSTYFVILQSPFYEISINGFWLALAKINTSFFFYIHHTRFVICRRTKYVRCFKVLYLRDRKNVNWMKQKQNDNKNTQNSF